MKIKTQCAICWASNAHALRTGAAIAVPTSISGGATTVCQLFKSWEVIWHED